MNIGLLNEVDDDRVALVPESIKRLESENNEVCVEKNAGRGAYVDDWEFKDAGARLESRETVIREAELFISLKPLAKSDLSKLKEDSVVISLFEPFTYPERLKEYAKFPLTYFSLDMIPRITRAQTMDVLSSMASIAGYKAMILAARYLPRYFPMLTSAAGTIPPAKILVLGAGVAGLQAVATAKRLGGVVEVFDTRVAVKEEVESLAAKFVEVEGASEDASAGGYAVEQTEEYKRKQTEKIQERARASDIIVTTAQIRGKRAPLLISKETVNEMRPGSVIVDLATSSGGNCELSQDDKVVEKYDVTIVGNSNLASTMPVHASQLFSRNVYNYLKVLIKDGNINLDFDDEIINSSCIIHKGDIKFKTT